MILNKSLCREHYTLPVLDDILHRMKGAQYFSNADLSCGYWHVKLDEPSSYLTTFQTCFGRFRWLRLPFGLKVSSEIFQRRLLDIFYNLDGVICIADDILIFGKTKEEHDANIVQFISTCKRAGIKLNRDKMQIEEYKITFMGHQVIRNGVKMDPEKVEAIQNTNQPTVDTVNTAKRLLRKYKAASEDPYLGLLNVRNTPQQNMGPSPAQIFLGRRTNTLVPTLSKKPESSI